MWDKDQTIVGGLLLPSVRASADLSSGLHRQTGLERASREMPEVQSQVLLVLRDR